jgi:hypothetical protein
MSGEGRANKAGQGRKPHCFRRTMQRWFQHWLFGTERPWMYEDVHPVKAWFGKLGR